MFFLPHKSPLLEVRIMGFKSVLLRTLVATASKKMAGFGVLSFVPKWRARPTTSDRHAAIGWEMLSAAAYPVVLFGGRHLPAILPQSDNLHTLL